MQTGRVIDAKSGTVKPPVTLRFGPVALRFGNARLAGATAKHDKMPVAFTDSPAILRHNQLAHSTGHVFKLY